MTPTRNRFAAPAIAVLIWAAGAPVLSAQTEGSWLCRVHFEEQTTGGDTLATRGVIELTRAAPQADGSIHYMGEGHAEIVHTAAGACTTVSGARVSARLMGIVTSEDGRTVEVDIAPLDHEFPTTVRCGPGSYETNVGVSVPPTVSLAYRDGATATYEDETSSVFARFARGGVRGTVRLEFCRPS